MGFYVECENGRQILYEKIMKPQNLSSKRFSD
jgi:hypothetical protein